jgi:hypothetical protein
MPLLVVVLLTLMWVFGGANILYTFADARSKQAYAERITPLIVESEVHKRVEKAAENTIRLKIDALKPDVDRLGEEVSKRLAASSGILAAEIGGKKATTLLLEQGIDP